MREGDERDGAERETSRPDLPGAGVDSTLIDEMLRLSPAERLRQNDRMATVAVKLRAGFDARAARWPSRAT
jgi:hypothetical protein